MASLDTEILLRGANRLAKQREKQRKAARERREGVSSQEMARIERELAQDVGSSETGGIQLEDLARDAEFGEAAEMEYDLAGNPKEMRRPQDDDQSYSRDEAIRMGVREELEDIIGVPERDLTREQARRLESVTKDKAAFFARPVPEIALKQALDQVNRAAAQNQGLVGTLSGKKQGLAAVAGSMEDKLAYGKKQRDAEKSLAGELARRDQERQNPMVRAMQDEQYRVELESLRRRNPYAPIADQIANENLERAIVTGAGTVPDMLDAVKVDGVYVDPRTGESVLESQPATTAIAGSNTPDNAQMLNAPNQNSAVSWAAKQIGTPEDAAYASRKVPQIDIGAVTGDFADRVRGLATRKGFEGQFDLMPANVRTLDELQKTVDAITRVGKASGVQFTAPREVRIAGSGGKTRMRDMPSDNPGVAEVMSLLRMGPQQQQQLAQAMYQLEMARNMEMSPEYFARKSEGRDFGNTTVTNAAQVMKSLNPGDSSVGVATLDRNDKVRVGGKRVSVRDTLRNLESEGAQQPFIGAPAGERPERARFAREADIVKQPAQRAGMDPAKREIVEELERREGEERQLRRDRVMNAQPPGEPGIAGTSRAAREAQIAELAQRASGAAEAAGAKPRLEAGERRPEGYGRKEFGYGKVRRPF